MALFVSFHIHVYRYVIRIIFYLIFLFYIFHVLCLELDVSLLLL
jgi:hypothetical protein